MSTTKVTFRLTSDEARRLDDLVKEFGHRDRSALLRAWLAQSGPARRIASEGSSPQVRAKSTKQVMDEMAAARSNLKDELRQQAAPLNDLTLSDLFNLASSPKQASTTKSPVDAKQKTDEVAAAHSNRKDQPPQQADPSEAFYGLFTLVLAAIHSEADPRSVWSRIPSAVRRLLQVVTPAQAHMTMELLQRAGMLELQPPNGRYERVRLEDAALCPRDARGKVLSRARVIVKG